VQKGVFPIENYQTFLLIILGGNIIRFYSVENRNENGLNNVNFVDKNTILRNWMIILKTKISN